MKLAHSPPSKYNQLVHDGCSANKRTTKHTVLFSFEAFRKTTPVTRYEIFDAWKMPLVEQFQSLASQPGLWGPRGRSVDELAGGWWIMTSSMEDVSGLFRSRDVSGSFKGINLWIQKRAHTHTHSSPMFTARTLLWVEGVSALFLSLFLHGRVLKTIFFWTRRTQFVACLSLFLNQVISRRIWSWQMASIFGHWTHSMKTGDFACFVTLPHAPELNRRSLLLRSYLFDVEGVNLIAKLQHWFPWNLFVEELPVISKW